jgi:hypothetical protein
MRVRSDRRGPLILELRPHEARSAIARIVRADRVERPAVLCTAALPAPFGSETMDRPPEAGWSDPQ